MAYPWRSCVLASSLASSGASANARGVASCGRGACASCEHPLLALRVLDAAAGDVEVFGLNLDPNELAAQVYAGNASGPGAHEWIDHNAARPSDELLYQVNGLFRWMFAVPGTRCQHNVSRPFARPRVLRTWPEHGDLGLPCVFMFKVSHRPVVLHPSDA